MGTDFTLLTAIGYCIPQDEFDRLIKGLCQEHPSVRQWQTEFDETGEWDEDVVSIGYSNQEHYRQSEQFNKRCFIYDVSTAHHLCANKKIGGSTLIQLCPIRDEPEWKETGLYGGARLPMAIRLQETTEKEQKDMDNLLKESNPILAKAIIKQFAQYKGNWLFSYFS